MTETTQNYDIWTTSKGDMLELSRMAYPHLENCVKKLERTLHDLKAGTVQAVVAAQNFNRAEYTAALAKFDDEVTKVETVTKHAEAWIHAFRNEMSKRPAVDNG